VSNLLEPIDEGAYWVMVKGRTKWELCQYSEHWKSFREIWDEGDGYQIEDLERMILIPRPEEHDD